MTDLEKAIIALDGHSVALCKGDNLIIRDGRGISPLIELIESGEDFSGFAAADLIIGKAAAMLFYKLGVHEVYGKVMSRQGAAFLSVHDIPKSCGELCENIINRKGDDICPMEKTVAGINDPGAALAALKNKLNELKAGSRP